MKACALLSNFNSRPSARGDIAGESGKPNIRISIHAPPRGATVADAIATRDDPISIHAPPRGATNRRQQQTQQTQFQFTPLREGRQSRRLKKRAARGFQFTPLREGRRVSSFFAAFAASISIHAPPRGATLSCDTIAEWLPFQFTPLREGRRTPPPPRSADAAISIHAPPRGATSAVRFSIFLTSYFNSRPSARGDQIVSAFSHSCLSFQFTPLREGRPGQSCFAGSCGRDFNSRPSARGDVRWPTLNICWT